MVAKRLSLSHRIVTLELTLPAKVAYLHIGSTLISLTILVVSLLDLGILSFYCNPCISTITEFYHCVVFMMSRRARKANEPSFFWTLVICGDVLAVLWLLALIANIIFLILDTGYNPEILRNTIHLPTPLVTQPLQITLTAMECTVLTSTSIYSHVLIRRQGEVRWRRLQHDTSITPFMTTSFQLPEKTFFPDSSTIQA